MEDSPIVAIMGLIFGLFLFGIPAALITFILDYFYPWMFEDVLPNVLLSGGVGTAVGMGIFMIFEGIYG